MKRWFLCLSVCWVLAGCGLAMEDLQPFDMMPEQGTAGQRMKRRFISLRQARIGMSRGEVKSVLGTPVIIGYELIDPKGRQYRPLLVYNPQRAEDLKQGADVYHVDFYLAGVREQDNKISDDELVPLVYRGDHLAGMGWDYLNALKK